MMPVILPKSWKEEFAAAVAEKREDMIWKEKIAVSQRQERERRFEDEAEEARDKAATSEIIAFALATEQETALFRVRLEDYDVATVETLMNNEQSLAAVRERIDVMLEEAYVLPDGRRIFKTLDGQRVVDEHGQQLSKDFIDPDTIDDAKPRWESLQTLVKERVRLSEERAQLTDYQTKLDEARDLLDKGKITKSELKTLDDELKADMPDAVRDKLGLERPKAETGYEKDPIDRQHNAAAAMPNTMDALMRGTGLGGPPSF